MSDWIIHHGVPGMKWGVRRYQNKDGTLTSAGKQHSKENRMASNIYEKAKRDEPAITSKVKSVAKAAGCKMYGLEHRLKTKESLARKINADSIEKNIVSEQAAKDIKDSLRYTMIQNNKDFTKSYFKVKELLEKSGYKEIKCKNYFDQYVKGLAKHKQVTSVFQSDDKKFEIQFQTPESILAKEKKTPIYEERRKPGLSQARQRELEQIMVKLMDPVPIPNGVLKIKSH